VQLNIDFLRVGGVYQAAFSLLNYICRNVDNVVISKFSGAANLGLYDRAYQLMKYPISIISFAIMPALQPVLRSSSMDAEDSKRLHADLTIKLGSLAFLFSVFIYYFSGEIVQMLFGSKWIDVAELLKILALSLPAQIISSVSGSYFNANNRQNLLLMSGVLSVISCVFAISFGLFYGGLLGVCWGLFFAFLINCLFAKYLIYKYIFFENFSGYLFRILLLIAITLMATVFASWLFREVVVL
jgi:PST family polysaccharide transporter